MDAAEDDDLDTFDDVMCWRYEDARHDFGWGRFVEIGMQRRCTQQQRKRLARLRDIIGFDDQDSWKSRLLVYNKTDMKDLSRDEADDLEEKLKIRLKTHGTITEKRARQWRRYTNPDG